VRAVAVKARIFKTRDSQLDSRQKREKEFVYVCDLCKRSGTGCY
jgi:hypothetical protein